MLAALGSVRARVLALGAGAAALYLVASATWPGLYTDDSRRQLRQALSGVYVDAQPPLMAWLWSGLLRLTGSPASLFVLHLALLAAGLLLWAFVLLRLGLPESVPLLALAAWNPVVLNFAGLVHNDVGLAMVLLVGFALAALMKARARPSSTLLAVILLLAFYAIGVRWNSLPAVLPLAYLTATCFVPPRSWRARAVAGSIAVAGCGLFALANVFVAYGWLDATRHHFEQNIQLFDLAGIAVRTGDYAVIPHEFRSRRYTDAGLEQAYAVYNLDPLFGTPATGPTMLTPSHDRATLSRLSRAWLTALREHPVAFLRHKAAVFLSLLRIGHREPYLAKIPYRLRLEPSRWPGHEASMAVLDLVNVLVRPTRLLLGWPWVIVLTAVSIGSVWVREPVRSLTMALGLSGLAYIATYVPISPASDFRYLYWSVVAATLGVVMLAGAAAQRWRRRVAPGGERAS